MARVLVVGDRVVSHYWRKNPHEDWRPTSTGFGSYLDFSPLPEIVINDCIAYTKRLGLAMGAYDVTFEMDDISSEPLVLEVSPLFSLNPMIKGDRVLDYAKFKEKVFVKNSFWKLQIDQLLLISQKYLQSINLKGNDFS
ncbi:hypothetical protein N9Z52_00040 [Akkermansiaceae bacterium]|nr:hypothetical protein [Akkermansiaceae bacterium]